MAYESWAELLNATDETGQPLNVEGRDFLVVARPDPAVSVLHLAIHGGGIESPTSQLAELASRPYGPYYTLSGLRSTGNAALIIPATRYDEPRALAAVAEADRTVSWHGVPDPDVGQLDVTNVSGLDRELVVAVRRRLSAAGFRVEFGADDVDGDALDNITNLNRRRAGVQLELSRTQRAALVRNGDLTQAAVNNPVNWLPAFHAFVTAVNGAVDEIQAQPSALPSPPPAVGTLGCAGEYQAAIFHRGGQRVFIPAARLGVNVTSVEWERRLKDTSAARVVIAKRQLDAECCADLGTADPWCHELAVYRDQDLVWQGPILRVNEEEAQITIDAVDVTAWLAKLVNTQSSVYVNQDPARIAASFISRNLNDATLATPTVDWAGILPYLYRPENTPGVRWTTVSRFASIWTDTVLTVVNNMADKGFEWTTLGRRLVMRPPRSEAKDRARARLVPEHLPGGLSVIKDGEDAATRVFATSQTDTEPGITVSVARPKATAVCGRLDMLVRENPRVEVETEAQKQKRIDAVRKKRDQREDAADNTYDTQVSARRKSANAALKAIAALSDTACNRKCKDDRSDDERDDRDNDIQKYRKIRDKAKQTARTQYTSDLAASNKAIADRVASATRGILTTLAKQTLVGRWPVPTVIVVQDNARLSSEAPITIDELVCGERIDVAAVGFCRPVAQAMKLTAVRGKWDRAGEEIGVSLTPLTPILED